MPDIPKQIQIKFSEGSSAYNSGNYAKAASIYNECIKDLKNLNYSGQFNKVLSELYSYLGDVYYFSQNYVDTIDSLKSSISYFKRTDNGIQFWQLALSYAEIKQFKEAVDNFKICLNMPFPKDNLYTHGDVLLNIGICLTEIFDRSKEHKFLLEAIKILELCFSLYPDNTKCKQQLQISKFILKTT